MSNSQEIVEQLEKMSPPKRKERDLFVFKNVYLDMLEENDYNMLYQHMFKINSFLNYLCCVDNPEYNDICIAKNQIIKDMVDRTKVNNTFDDRPPFITRFYRYDPTKIQKILKQQHISWPI